MSKKPIVSATILMQVETQIIIEEGETAETVKDRFADIYLHGFGEDGFYDKEDLGGDSTIIVHDDSKEAAEYTHINKALLMALIDTAKRTTDLDGVYNDKTNQFFWWDDVNKLAEA